MTRRFRHRETESCSSRAREGSSVVRNTRNELFPLQLVRLRGIGGIFVTGDVVCYADDVIHTLNRLDTCRAVATYCSARKGIRPEYEHTQLPNRRE